MLPPGQRARDDFPRFGLSQFAHRVPEPSALFIRVSGDVDPLIIDAEALASLSRVEQTSDLHCVTTWSKTGLQWSGYRLTDVFRVLIQPHVTAPIHYVHLKSADGFRARLQMSDAMAEDVLLVDSLNGEPLPLRHGGPVRLVAPQHYGYKSPKHVVHISVTEQPPSWRGPTPFAFMEHPRARVAREERGTIFPGWLLRWLYRPLIASTVRSFERGWEQRDGA